MNQWLVQVDPRKPAAHPPQLLSAVLTEMIDQCWIDGANTYIKQDEEVLKKDPNFKERQSIAPKCTILGRGRES
jgi:hypothetical protein